MHLETSLATHTQEFTSKLYDQKLDAILESAFYQELSTN
jgi:hypothetical protein